MKLLRLVLLLTISSYLLSDDAQKATEDSQKAAANLKFDPNSCHITFYCKIIAKTGMTGKCVNNRCVFTKKVAKPPRRHKIIGYSGNVIGYSDEHGNFYHHSS